jgi:type II secretory ATPase GspE/PulE/Tfp pilus assembly ATPase PilB-like protein
MASSRSTPAVPPRWPDQWLADAAVRRAVVSAEQLAPHVQLPSAWSALLACGLIDDAVLELSCAASATKPADLAHIQPAAIAAVRAVVAERLDLIPIRLEGHLLHVATANPLRDGLEQDLANTTGKRILVLSAKPDAVLAARAVHYPAARSAVSTPVSSNVAAVAEAAADAEGGRSHIALLLDQLFAEALGDGASDIHFEPAADGLLVRFRVDGGLHEARRVGIDRSTQVVRRLKVLAGMDIADTLRPQDGRLSVTIDGRNIDMRVSTLPLGGSSEKVVVRLLDSNVSARELDVVGYTPKELERVKRLLELPEGLILVTGPTGSGKTSTLYAALRHVHRSDLNIITVEDPIEYRIAGINQVQVNEKARMTFAASLRSILRQDPDVVLIGEMRDAETASIAVKAAMTGHLVLSTLHASDAISTLDRLYGMDIDTSALAAALKGIVGQRLVRKLCECAAPVRVDELPLRQQQLLRGRATGALRVPVGCAKCRGSGYRGRTTVAEVLIVNSALQRGIARRADLAELKELAQGSGTVFMWESGIERVLSGVTSLGELLDNVAAPSMETEPDQAQADVDALLAELFAKPTLHPTVAREKLPDIGDAVVGRNRGGAGTPPADAVLPIRRPSAPLAANALRVLIVDDVTADRRLLADALTAEGLMVIEAADGDAALAYARRLAPDVIITEIALPKLDAIGLLQALRADRVAARVLVRTRQNDTALRAWLLEIGAEEIVSAALDVRQLATRIRGQTIAAA